MRNGDYTPTRLEAQQGACAARATEMASLASLSFQRHPNSLFSIADAVNVLCGVKTQQHPGKALQKGFMLGHFFLNWITFYFFKIKNYFLSFFYINFNVIREYCIGFENGRWSTNIGDVNSRHGFTTGRCPWRKMKRNNFFKKKKNAFLFFQNIFFTLPLRLS